MKLSDRQEVALIALATLDDAEFGAWHGRVPLAKADTTVLRRAARTNTLDSLVRLGLAESRVVRPGLDWQYRISPAGRILLASMGD